MFAVFDKGDGSLVHVDDFEHEIDTDRRRFYFDGNVDGLVRDNYTVERAIEVYDVVNDLSSCLPRISGRYAGVSVQDGSLEFATSDIGAVEELYYSTTETELIVSTDFFALAKAKGRQLEYETSEVLRFVKHGYCRKGKTTFKEINRLPPGEMLHLDKNRMTSTRNYMNSFQGLTVTFDVFKNAISHSINSVIENNPHFEEVVEFSGGVDSSVLLSLIRGSKDMTAITYRFFPSISPQDDSDAMKLERIAKKLQITPELIDVNLNEIPLSYVDDIILSMPFAAHLGINFKKIFEAMCSPKKRLWSGQNMDTLYYYAMSETLPVNRFLLSSAYVQTLKGVKGYERYRPGKTALDLSLKWLYRFTHAQSLQTPKSVVDLIEFFNDSNGYLALRIGGKQNEDQTSKLETSEVIKASEIRRRLFDEELGCFFTGRDHKIQLQAIRLYDITLALPYSAPSVVQLLRNLNLSWLDVLIAKRFMYQYARELGLFRSDFRVPLVKRSRSTSQKKMRVFESTSFGIELRQKTADLTSRIGLPINFADSRQRQTALGLLWLNKVREELGRVGLAPRWPIFRAE